MDSKRQLEIVDALPVIREMVKEGTFADYTFPNALGSVRVIIMYHDEHLNNLEEIVKNYFTEVDDEIGEESIQEFRQYFEAAHFARYNEYVIGQIIDWIITHERQKLLLIGNN
jgi:hypothetical protein